MKDCAIVIPARLGSQRFPNKLIQPVSGKPLVLWTAENVRNIAPDIPLFFAVADPELETLLTSEGYRCVMTDPDLPSGTDRLAAANREINAEWIINVQADEPVLVASHIEQLQSVLGSGADVATLATCFESEIDFKDPNKVKVVIGSNDRALYFSRSPIPYDRDQSGGLPGNAYWHLGLYGYHREVLQAFSSWKPTYLETTEKLEQLRILENGGTIGVGITTTRTIGVDTPEDLEQLEQFLRGN